MIAYKFKNIILEKDENGFNYIKIRMIEKFKDGKYVKFIPLNQAIEVLKKAVIYEKDFDTILSLSEKKKLLNQKKLGEITLF